MEFLEVSKERQLTDQRKLSLCAQTGLQIICAKNDASLSYSFSLVTAAQPEENLKKKKKKYFFDCSVLSLAHIRPKPVHTFCANKAVLSSPSSKLPFASFLHRCLYTVSQLQIPPT